MEIATHIQHHRSRAHLLPELLARLDGLNPQVVTDPGGRRVSAWRTHRLCIESIPADATHLLVVQDDARPCERFAEAVHAAITERPERIICLFVSGLFARGVNIARKKRERWFELGALSYVPLVAVVYPVGIAREIPAFADAKRMPITRADDAIVGQYVRATRQSACATLPCLVEHLDAERSVTGMAHGTGAAHRLAAWFEESPAVV